MRQWEANGDETTPVPALVDRFGGAIRRFFTPERVDDDEPDMWGEREVRTGEQRSFGEAG